MGGKKRVAIVGGAGSWGRNYTRAFVEHPGCEVVGLVENAGDRAAAFAAHYGIETVYRDVDALLAGVVPEIVSAILPVKYIHDVVIACAEAGVKVISCEKPIDYELSRADETVRACVERGALLGCGTALYMWPHTVALLEWLRAGNLGEVTGATIPGGLPTEVSGGGCHLLALMRNLTGLEAEWVEGWLLPPVPEYVAPEASPREIDRPAYGRIGLQGGAICTLPAPRPELPIDCNCGVSCEGGQVWVTRSEPVIIHGTGAEASPIRPPFLDDPTPGHWIEPVVDRLVVASETGELLCTGHDYRQVLEIAIALTLSAHEGNRRVQLPLEDRSARIYPCPYRMHGGDVTGWEGNSSEPAVI